MPSFSHSTLHFRVTFKLLMVLIIDADLKISQVLYPKYEIAFREITLPAMFEKI